MNPLDAGFHDEGFESAREAAGLPKAGAPGDPSRKAAAPPAQAKPAAAPAPAAAIPAPAPAGAVTSSPITRCEWP